MLKLEAVTLTGHTVRLEPLQMKHGAELYTASQDPAIWTYMPVHAYRSLAEMEQLIRAALHEHDAGTCQAFAIIDLAQGRAVGSTRYLNWMLQDRGVEIGWTWIAPSMQRTGVNTECKYLLLRRAFEVLGAIRVQLKTHYLNVKSQLAIERLGAVKEGVLRNHMIMPDGSYRHSVFYSIIESEWPRVKEALETRMQWYSHGQKN
jgi:N-acetyltransferase